MALTALVASAFFINSAIAQKTPQAREIGGKFLCMCGCTQVLTQCNHVGCTVSTVMLKQIDQTLARGELMLLSYSLGLGVPFVVAGVAFGRLSAVFAWVKRHFRTVNLASGAVLAAFGVMLLTNNVHYLSTFFINLLDKVGLQRLSSSI